VTYKAIGDFLGVKPDQEGLVFPDRHLYFYYKSQKLNYAIFLDLEKKLLSMGGGFNDPFGYDSIFEIAVEWDAISIETEPQFYGDQQILVCRKNYPEFQNYKTLMVMKWPNEELSIWPSQCVRSQVNEN
jgi:hypothetical protein